MHSLPDVIEVEIVRGENSSEDRAPDLVIEVPHGATRTRDFTALQSLLKSPLPDALEDFFHVNTDAGAPELALATALHFVALEATRTVCILRSAIPRTFIDCNRRIDSAPEDFKAAKVTPGLMPWITAPEDRALLRARYEKYSSRVREAVLRALPSGALLMLHTYAPRTVDVEVDAHIVSNLRRAYAPGVLDTFPLRPEVDIIGRSLDGESYAPARVVDVLRREMLSVGVTVAEGVTYPLHPSTMAWDHALAWPGRTLCVEVRRDLVAEPFEPFAQMNISRAKVDRLAGPLSKALCAWW